jgi:hypothetical protein
MMSRWNFQVGIWQMIWTNVVVGLGFGMSFPILSAAAMSTVERERMGYATSLFNMLQQQGRAIGFLEGGLHNFSNIRQQGMTPEARSGQRLLVGPWPHLYPYDVPTSTVGELDMGPNR